ncbi:hypothetical protein KP13_32158 [Klebsiella pneumoniae subsp. pneumoniae Kp13]|nr:hypothetical protein KP13_32158 [Klebsiella pneumoniae subsp. pneumoniae Kp13]
MAKDNEGKNRKIMFFLCIAIGVLYEINAFFTFLYFYIKYSCLIFTCSAGKIHKQCWRRGGKRNNSSLGGRAGWR